MFTIMPMLAAIAASASTATSTAAFTAASTAVFTVSTAAQAVGAEGEGLTLAELIARIPHEPVAIFTYVLLVGSIGGILWIGRPRGPRSPGAVT